MICHRHRKCLGRYVKLFEQCKYTRRIFAAGEDRNYDGEGGTLSVVRERGRGEYPTCEYQHAIRETAFALLLPSRLLERTYFLHRMSVRVKQLYIHRIAFTIDDGDIQDLRRFDLPRMKPFSGEFHLEN